MLKQSSLSLLKMYGSRDKGFSSVVDPDPALILARSRSDPEKIPYPDLIFSTRKAVNYLPIFLQNGPHTFIFP